MAFLTDLARREYCCRTDLNLYNSPHCQELATQAATGRHLKLLSVTPVEAAIQIQLCEDSYCAWLPIDSLTELEPAQTPYQAIALTRADIEPRLPDVIAFTHRAMDPPNYYLWGGTIGPNYDCSGLIQAAFAASGIWLPRDSYQQEEFTESISREEMLPGDLIFFGESRVNHVALYLGEGRYIHSSGTTKGRNGIGIDELSEANAVSKAYYHKLWSFGRVFVGL